MKEIPLTQGKVALVDDEDYDWLMQWKWSVSSSSTKPYAVRWTSGNRKVRMHRAILNLPDGVVGDHINLNTLDNRRCNLRPATKAQNNQNTKGRINTSSQYKGVSWDINKERWVAQIWANDKKYWLGTFRSEHEAAHAYDAAACIHHGEFAKTNF